MHFNKAPGILDYLELGDILVSDLHPIGVCFTFTNRLGGVSRVKETAVASCTFPIIVKALPSMEIMTIGV